MRRVSIREYLDFVDKVGEVEVEGVRIPLEPIKVERIEPGQDEISDTGATVWSFPRRGSWATHKGDYRGNWPPQMARALILAYTKPGDIVLDPMVGSGTTCIEARLLGRSCIGVDISYGAVMLTLHRLYWLEKSIESGAVEEPSGWRDSWVEVYHGDARNLSLIGDSTVDLVATHPPYYNIIRYNRGGVEGDLSSARSLEEYLEMLGEAAREAYRVLKPGRHLAILLGDTRSRRHYVPITHYSLQLLLGLGFILREEVVKIQHKMKGTRERWSRVKDRDFLLIYHEKLFVFRKPESDGDYRRYKYSSWAGVEAVASALRSLRGR